MALLDLENGAEAVNWHVEVTEGLVEQIRDAEVLVIEATFLERDASVARDTCY
jgi:hypothetical protein